jgi:hypothetical protein
MSLMNNAHEMTTAETVAWQDSEHPACDTCDGRLGLDCHGHCPDCGEASMAGEDVCAACFAKGAA